MLLCFLPFFYDFTLKDLLHKHEEQYTFMSSTSYEAEHFSNLNF